VKATGDEVGETKFGRLSNVEFLKDLGDSLALLNDPRSNQADEGVRDAGEAALAAVGGAGLGGGAGGVSELLSSVTVKELRRELDARGLSKTGRKAALIQRLAEAMGDIDVVELEAMDMFNG
jgi:hypothetical protein